MADGHTLLEVEFPPLSTEMMEDTNSSAYDISRANVRLASQFGEFFSGENKTIRVLLPDDAELSRAVEDEVRVIDCIVYCTSALAFSRVCTIAF